MKPQIPVLPVYERGCRRRAANYDQSHACVLDAGSAIFLDSGRTAIRLALAHGGLEPGDEVLVPAFHCPTMAEPVRELGGTVVFYPIRRDTSIDFAGVERLLSTRSRAILVPHFFGIPQDMAAIMERAHSRGLVVIEDCAHAFFGEIDGVPVGSSGDYAIASTRKFFAGADGGVLVSSRRPLHVSCLRPSIADQARALVNVIEESAIYNRLGAWSGPAVLATRLLTGVSRAVRRTGSGVSGPGGGGNKDGTARPRGFRCMSRISRRLLETTDRTESTRRRIKNYEYLAKRFAGMDDMVPLRPVPAQGIAPYMFPLIVRDSGIYDATREKGWPLWRWDDSDTSCEVSAYYARHLVQVPCHQSLHGTDLDGLVDAMTGCRRTR